MKAYIDGACSGNPGPGGFGIILLDDDFGEMHISGGKEYTTNNEMELMAFLRLLEVCNNKSLEIYTDSMYVINCFKYYKVWKYKEDLKNRRIVLRINDILSNLEFKNKIIIKKVKGHSGDYYNEKVDKLAKSYIQNFKKGEKK